MAEILLCTRFLLIAATNLCLFLVVATWCFIPVYIVELGGSSADAGFVMGSLGITSLGSLPFLAPLIDRYGRKVFIVGGILVIGISNAAFLLFDTYSPLMILVRLVQGVAFAACFNGCATAVIDIVPEEKRAQGIGLFGVSGSLAVAIGPFLGEICITKWDFQAYFYLLVGFGLIGFLTALFVPESTTRKTTREKMQGFFPTAIRGGYLAMMAVAVIFGSGFAAMNTFFPLFAKSLGIQAGIFFVCYGSALFLVRVFLGQIVDRVSKERLIFLCLMGFGLLLVSTSRLESVGQTALLGALFGIAQGLSYPAMMARMLSRSSAENRAVVVALFTGSFGVGINVSVLAWGCMADFNGLPFMFLTGGAIMFICAAIYFLSVFAFGVHPSPTGTLIENKGPGAATR